MRRAAGLAHAATVLTGAVTDDGTWLLGTRDELLLLPPAGVPTRLPWQQVERADWDRDSERLVVAEVGQFGVVRPTHSFVISDPGLLLELVRERVTASVVLQRRVVVAGKKGLFVVARRPPRGTGEVTWAYELDPGLDPEDPAVQAAARRGLKAAAEEMGSGFPAI